MNILKVRNMVLGEGVPKICVPIVGITKEDILSEARALERIPVDIVEWRVDWFENVFDLEKTKAVLKELRLVLEDMPLLVTFRTKKEGGEKEITPEEYKNFNIAIAKTKLADMIDVEAFTGDELIKEVIEQTHAVGVKVVASNHDFFKTPPKDEIIARLVKMQDLGADVLKIAVMSNSEEDVLTLLSATEEMNRLYSDRPIITMSMGDKGVISRLAGEIFGSALTFGAVRKASAPGQIGVKELSDVLNIIHKSI